jgi:carbon monoxide dehydrogenase subunit G
MPNAVDTALLVTRALRASPGYAGLGTGERQALERDLARIEQVMSGAQALGEQTDPYAVPLETPADLQRGFGPSPMAPAASPAPRPSTSAPNGSAAPTTGKPAGTEVIGTRARQALDAVDFTAFVAGLVNGTFQAIVDATARQVREYANLVASISRSVGDFSRDNVTEQQVRVWLADRHGADLQLQAPKPGEPGEPRLVPRRRSDTPPTWLKNYGLEAETWDSDWSDGALVEAARTGVGEERLQTLATMVLMGINRIVVDDGQIRARLQFHAKAQESVRADIAMQGAQAGIAGRAVENQPSVSTMVSTVNVNAQADVALKADLVGEVSIRFRTETFNLERFADSPAIQLINRHARLREPAATATPAAPATAPVTTPSPTPGGTS